MDDGLIEIPETPETPAPPELEQLALDLPAERAAIVTDGVVTNIILIPSGSSWTPDTGTLVTGVADTVNIGDTYANGIFTPATPILPVPSSITRRQCARALFARQMISGPEMVAMAATGTPPAMILAAFSAFPEAERWVALTDFAAATYLRTNPLLVGIMTSTGASSADIDDFFRAAASL